MSAVMRLKPVNTIHPALREFYFRKAIGSVNWEKWREEHARKTLEIQSLIVQGKLDERQAPSRYAN